MKGWNCSILCMKRSQYSSGSCTVERFITSFQIFSAFVITCHHIKTFLLTTFMSHLYIHYKYYRQTIHVDKVPGWSLFPRLLWHPWAEGKISICVYISLDHAVCSAAKARNSLKLRSTDSLSGSTEAKQVHNQACWNIYSIVCLSLSSPIASSLKALQLKSPFTKHYIHIFGNLPLK